MLKLLQSLGLEKYSITFQAEEVCCYFCSGFFPGSLNLYRVSMMQVDMAVLEHMNDDDLKALGIPMVNN